MCILFIALQQHPRYPLIVAANRDEFHQRPTTPSHFWQSPDGLLAGRDDSAGGTWMGVTRNGKIGALTNIRDPKRINSDARSRGELIINYVQQSGSPKEHIKTLSANRHAYNGYNLLFGDIRQQTLWVYNNFSDEVKRLTPGFYGLSNADLDHPWPKIERGKLALSHYCETHKHLSTDALFAILTDATQADDHQLPETGVPYEWEKRLSSIFIHGESYGTRSSTLLLLDNEGEVSWYEQSYDPSGRQIAQQHYQFNLRNNGSKYSST